MPNNPEPREPREIEVSEETGFMLEYDRTVRVELSVSENHATVLRLNRAEAEALLQALAAHLEGAPDVDAR